MRYTVVWTPAAERDMASLWANSGQRNAITLAAAQIDVLLKNDAHQRGTARGDGLRYVAVGPLIAFFRVSELDRFVWVLGFRLRPPNNQGNNGVAARR